MSRDDQARALKAVMTDRLRRVAPERVDHVIAEHATWTVRTRRVEAAILRRMVRHARPMDDANRRRARVLAAVLRRIAGER